MCFCVNGRQPLSVIKMADEIKFLYSDRDKIFDLIEEYSDKTIILESGDEVNWKTLQMYNEKFKEFYIALHDLRQYKDFNDAGIKWYWPYPITSFYELERIIKLNPSYLMIGPPLSFDLDKVKSLAMDIPLRMHVNIAHPAYLPDTGHYGIHGQWVRPEDIEKYSDKIRCFEFDECASLAEEETYLRTYLSQHWPGNLNLLIKRLNFNVDNRAIPEDLGETRMNCGQRCCAGSGCHLCDSAFIFADVLRKHSLSRKQKDDIDNN
jgi:hypothetical protein